MNTQEIIKNLQDLDVEALHEISARISELIREKSAYVIVKLRYNRYYGSGKCWVAEVDKETKKILNFVNAESVEKRDWYSGKKIFKLKDGFYLFNQEGSKSNDDRKYFQVKNGELIRF